MGVVRKPFQGTFNIIRFNWHFYIISLFAVLFLLVGSIFIDKNSIYAIILALFILLLNLISLTVSYYIYDWSGLYNFPWLSTIGKKYKVLNINSGFDETSEILRSKFPNSEFLLFDFYDSDKHTEISIKRARSAYPASIGTISIEASAIPVEDSFADKIFLIFSAHEIRDEAERMLFFNELNRIIKPDGEVIVIEHLRDIANFMAYNIGFLHFHSKFSWLKAFTNTGFFVKNEFKLTPFISTFILQKHGDTF